MTSNLIHRSGGLKTQVAYLFGSNLVDRLLGLAGSIVIARYLGASEFGRVGPALVLGALVARLTDVGVSVTLQRDVAREPANAAPLLARAFGFRALSSGFGLAVVIVYALAGEGATVRAWLPILAGAGALCAGWFQMFASVWIGCLRTEYLAIAQATYRLLSLALIGVAILVGGGSNAIMLMLLVASATQLLAGAFITRRAFFAPSVAVSVSSCVALVRDSWPIGVSAFSVMAYDRVDTLVASWFLAAAAVGNYFAAYALYSGALTVSNAITSVVFSVFSKQANDPAALRCAYRRTALLIAALGLAIAACLAVFAPLIVRLVYGARYQMAAGCLRILAIAIVFLFLNNLAGVTLNAMGRQRTTMILVCSAMALNLGLNLLTIPRFGIEAAAWSTVLTELAVVVAAGAAVEYFLRQDTVIVHRTAAVPEAPFAG